MHKISPPILLRSASLWVMIPIDVDSIMVEDFSELEISLSPEIEVRCCLEGVDTIRTDLKNGVLL